MIEDTLQRERQHPLTDRLLGQDVADEMRGGLCHASRTTAWTEAPAFATGCLQLRMPAGITLDPKEPALETPAFQVRLVLFVDAVGE